MCTCTLFQYNLQKDHWKRYLDNALHSVSPRFPFFCQKSLLLLFQTPHRVIFWCIYSFILLNEHYFLIFIVVVFQSLNLVQLFVSPWTAVHQASLSFTIAWSLLKLMYIESLVLCHHLLLLPSIFPRIRNISNELSPCIRWPMYWNFSFNISPFNEYSGLTSFRID